VRVPLHDEVVTLATTSPSERWTVLPVRASGTASSSYCHRIDRDCDVVLVVAPEQDGARDSAMIAASSDAIASNNSATRGRTRLIVTRMAISVETRARIVAPHGLGSDVADRKP